MRTAVIMLGATGLLAICGCDFKTAEPDESSIDDATITTDHMTIDSLPADGTAAEVSKPGAFDAPSDDEIKSNPDEGKDATRLADAVN